jgi:hypothetical protein
MVFANYFLKRYLSFFFILTFILAFIFNLIEFFEKLMRVANVDKQVIFHFICLNFLPSFSDLMPVGSWLASGLLLWELHQRHEWDTLFMIAVSYKTLLKLFVLGGFFMMISAFFIHEFLVLPLTAQSMRFKRERLRHGQQSKLINKSFMIKNDLFCSIGLLDIDAGIGYDFLLVSLSECFDIKRVISSPCFEMDITKKVLTLMQGTIFTRNDQSTVSLHEKKIKLPGFFVKLLMHDEAPLLINLIKIVFMQRAFLSQEIVDELWYLILQRIFFYFQILIYSILCFVVFALAENLGFYRWPLLITPYLVVTALGVLLMLLHQNHFSIIVLMFSFAVFILFVLFLSIILFKKKASL